MRPEVTKQSDVHHFKHFVNIKIDNYKRSLLRYNNMLSKQKGHKIVHIHCFVEYRENIIRKQLV